MTVATGVAAAPDAGVGEAFLDVRDVVKDFALRGGTVIRHRVATLTAVAGVSLSVARGEIFGLVGESGCGKSTLGRLLAALERPTSGQVWVDGEEVGALPATALRPLRRSIQMMFQDAYSSLDPRMRIDDIVREPLVIHRTLPRAAHAARVAQLLDEVGLSSQVARRFPHELSGGQRQRVGLARALALNPKLIVADEPVSALDVCIRAQILNLLVALHRAHGLTYVVISHDLSVIRYVADRVAVMYLGKIVEVGPTDDVYARPAHPYTAGLIDAIPVAEARTGVPRGA
ncbi:MAG TPA: ATP-binding cassette domain-containing protein, partial [Candidatus Dormibacteraeota bacterium]|nr:ATP-binding cassette domain-containing protein [Candidatus Dormibacteraeota bacterium]